MCCVIYFVIIFNILYRSIHGTDSSINRVQWKIDKEDYNRNNFDIPTTGVIMSNSKPLHIILEDYNIDANELRRTYKKCAKKRTFRFTTTFESKNEDGRNLLIIKVDEVTPDISTKWFCQLGTRTFTFKIRIKGQEKVYVDIGRERLKYSLTDLSVVDYDGSSEHQYESGETINLVCHRDDVSDANGSIKLTYYNANGTKLFETEQISARYPIYLIKIMSVNNDNEHVDCTYISTADIHYTYRTMFKYEYRAKSKNPLTISVQGVRMLPAVRGNREEYLYRFCEGENITVSCSMDEHVPGKLFLEFENSNYNQNFIQNEVATNLPWNSTKTYANYTLNATKLLCVGETNSKYVAEILLLTNQRETFIEGFSQQDIIQQYSRNQTTWLTDYWFTPGQTLNLTCITTYDINHKHRWIIQNKAGETEDKTSANNKYVLTLTMEHNDTSVICHDNAHGTAILHFIARPPVDAEEKILEEYMMLGGVAAVVLVIIITGLCCFVCRRRRARTAHMESRDNLPNNIEHPIPAYPSQWDSPDYANTEEAMVTNTLYITNGPMYARPLKKAERGIKPKDQSEPIYNVPHEGFDGGNDYVNSGPRRADRPYNDQGYSQLFMKHDGQKTGEPLYCEIEELKS